jgi:hypothetical protein
MKLLIDMVMAYRGYHGCSSKCGVAIYAPTQPGEVYVAIYTELDDNPGTSVTNAAETVATGIWEFLERPDTEITFIEHYRDRALIGGRPQFKEQFDRVTFEPIKGGFARPRWRRISKEEVERLTLGTPA